MDKLVESIYGICKAAQPLLGALVVLALVVLGANTIFNGADSGPKFKETIKWIIIGAAIGLTAASLGSWICGFFM